MAKYIYRKNKIYVTVQRCWHWCSWKQNAAIWRILKKNIPIVFFVTHHYILIILLNDWIFFLLNMIFHEHNVLEYTNKNDKSKRGGGVANADRADKGGRGGWGNTYNGWQRGDLGWGKDDNGYLSIYLY